MLDSYETGVRQMLDRCQRYVKQVLDTGGGGALKLCALLCCGDRFDVAMVMYVMVEES
jgi:hypothetical protein